MKNLNKILLVVVIVLVLILIGLLVKQYVGGNKTYYAVYLKTGDLYFGQLMKFPQFGLKNVYVLQVNPQDQQNPISVRKFTNVFWGPRDYININKNEVVWYTKLSEDSQLARLINSNPNLLPPAPQQPSQNPGFQQGQGSATSTNSQNNQ